MTSLITSLVVLTDIFSTRSFCLTSNIIRSFVQTEQKQFSLGADSNLSKERPHQAASAELRHALPRLGKQVPTHLRGWRSVLTLSENCRQQSPALI